MSGQPQAINPKNFKTTIGDLIYQNKNSRDHPLPVHKQGNPRNYASSIQDLIYQNNSGPAPRSPSTGKKMIGKKTDTNLLLQVSRTGVNRVSGDDNCDVVSDNGSIMSNSSFNSVNSRTSMRFQNVTSQARTKATYFKTSGVTTGEPLKQVAFGEIK